MRGRFSTNISLYIVFQSVAQKCLKKVWTDALHGARGVGRGGCSQWQRSHDGPRVHQPAAESPDVIPAWVSYPQSEIPLWLFLGCVSTW